MREIVHLQVGQCGNQIGSKVCVIIILHNMSSFFTHFLSKMFTSEEILPQIKSYNYTKKFFLFSSDEVTFNLKLSSAHEGHWLMHGFNNFNIFLLHLKNCARCAIERVFEEKNFNFGIDLRNFYFQLHFFLT